ncbi:M1 family metallopeptidase [Streptomyces sp. NPDC050560]|uniref:M1 family metallopeptidase n=1 Tax=Streptomyces sp. NPDC050560 TaxID=3365630 RepID=UPI0037B5AB48
MLAALLVLTAACGSVRDPAGPAGSRGLGDPYFPLLGNGGYDVTHYDLDLSYDPATDRLDGTARITARATQDLAAFDLDLLGLDVRRVGIGGKDARVHRDGQELTVRPARELREGRTFRTTVVYGGVPRRVVDPDRSEEGWLRTADGALALGQPQGSMTWFPGNHHPRDKATYDIAVTVPRGITVLSNGEPGPRRVHPDRSTTFVWRCAQPMASYLATVAIGKWRVQGLDDRGRRLPGPRGEAITAVDPRQPDSAARVLDRIPAIMAWERRYFGPYPFSSTGAIVDRPQDVGYALETQNRPTFGGPPDVETLVHELAHQWYGDSVTPKSWRDMWLNEGFATYAEWLWQEDHGGRSAQRSFDALYHDRYFDTPAANKAVWSAPPARPADAAHISDSPVYQRGAAVLHKVRQALGDRAFRGLLRGWAAERRHGVADTRDFTSYAESYAGKEAGHRARARLAGVWRDWLYGEGKPRKE